MATNKEIHDKATGKCQCGSCQLEEKIADLLEGQDVRDGIPALCSSLAEVLVQYADNDVGELGRILSHTTDRLNYFAARAFSRSERARGATFKDQLRTLALVVKGVEPKSPAETMAALPDDMPETVKSLLKGLIADGVEVQVIKV